MAGVTSDAITVFPDCSRRAHPVAPSHVSAVMSGAMIKTGIYGLVRLVFDIMGGGPDGLAVLIIGIGVIPVLSLFLQSSRTVEKGSEMLAATIAAQPGLHVRV